VVGGGKNRSKGEGLQKKEGRRDEGLLLKVIQGAAGPFWEHKTPFWGVWREGKKEGRKTGAEKGKEVGVQFIGEVPTCSKLPREEKWGGGKPLPRKHLITGERKRGDDTSSDN